MEHFRRPLGAPDDLGMLVVMANAEPVIRTFDFRLDYQSVRALWKTAGPGIQLSSSDEPDEIRKKLARDPDLFLVAEEDGRVVGTVLGGFDGRRGIIYHLAVVPELRRRGLGRALMQAIESRLLAKGCLKYYLLVTRDNPEALAFYEDFGCETMPLNVLGKRIG
jgi:ribosomal protein S18 acetylase RimI-like enzyme